MMPSKKCTAIKALLALALWSVAALALAAQVAGTVINLSGPLLAKKGDGTVKILTTKSEVENGDTLVSEKNTYARIKFVDDSEITLKPGTQFKVENFAFDEAKPDGDSAVFSLIKGGLRSVTGLLGKRNKEKYAMKTPTATIGIRGTTYVVEYIEPDASALAAYHAYNMASTAFADTGTRSDAGGVGALKPLQLAQGSPSSSKPVPGLYVSVTDGQIVLSNQGGSTSFTAGQFGYVKSQVTPPVIVPVNPAIRFTPPPAFSSSAVPSTNSTASSGKSGNVDCEVR